MSRILITGGNGFIGRNLASQLSARHDVVAPLRAQLDLLDAERVRAFVEDGQFDVVIHAATERSNRAHPGSADLLSRNCRMFFNLGRSRHAFGRMFFLSSGAVYDRTHWQPRMAEAYFDSHVPADDYGFSKYVCAKAIDAMDTAVEFRLFGVFGPHEEWRVRFLSNACCRAVWNLPIVIRQNVNFDYMDVEDLAWILDALLDRRLRHAHYNLCTGRSFDLVTLARMVVEVSGKQLEIAIRSEGLGREYSGDNSLLLQEIPDFQFREMKSSIAGLYHWYESQKDDIDPALLDFDWQ